MLDTAARYCPVLFDAPCLPSSDWAAWVQAIGSIGAILIAVIVANRAEFNAYQREIRRDRKLAEGKATEVLDAIDMEDASGIGEAVGVPDDWPGWACLSQKLTPIAYGHRFQNLRNEYSVFEGLGDELREMTRLRVRLGELAGKVEKKYFAELDASEELPPMIKTFREYVTLRNSVRPALDEIRQGTYRW